MSSSSSTCRPGAGPGLHPEIEAISAAVLAVAQHLEVREVLQTIVSAARTLLDAEYAALGVPDDNGGFAQFVVDGVSDEQWQAIGPLPRQHGLLAVMLHEAGPQRIDDIRSDPRFGWWPPAHPVLKDFLGMPIRAGDEILGALFLANKRDRPGFTDTDEKLLRLMAAHAAIALTNARLYERSRELSIVSERTRIARELHDAVAQKLFSLRLTADAADALVERDPARARTELATVRQLAREAADELRAVVVELRPADLQGDGLIATLRKQVEVLDRAHRTATVRFEAFCVRALPAVQEEIALRIAQEALHNALRHADARTVSVRLSGCGPGVVLEVGDDGRGFDPEAFRRGDHLGLGSMRDRARSVGGRLEIRTAPGMGTTVRLELPGAGDDRE